MPVVIADPAPDRSVRLAATMAANVAGLFTLPWLLFGGFSFLPWNPDIRLFLRCRFLGLWWLLWPFGLHWPFMILSPLRLLSAHSGAINTRFKFLLALLLLAGDFAAGKLLPVREYLGLIVLVIHDLGNGR